MNRELLNSQISRLPIEMAGIVHGVVNGGKGLSIYSHTASQLTKRLLP
ncbi:hypothetical protein [Cohnella sp.]